MDFEDPFVTEWKLTELAFKGSYEPKQSLAIGDYIFNNGDMYHITQSGHTMKAFRCWLTPVYETSADANAAKAFSFGFDGNETTGIDNVHANSLDNKSQKVYNMNGQQIDPLLGVQPGIYIVGGKKVVIK